jgi:HPt (histidine-containing phosphotransfer) domain-containing protein
MTNAVRRPLLDTAKADDEPWNQKTFGALKDLIGAREAIDLAARFRSDLHNRFADVMSRELLRRDAHAITSTSEVLGFVQLSRAARSLEAACETGEAFGSILQALVLAKAKATNALRCCIAPEQTSI